MVEVYWIGTALHYISFTAPAIPFGAAIPMSFWHRGAEPQSASSGYTRVKF